MNNFLNILIDLLHRLIEFFLRGGGPFMPSSMMVQSFGETMPQTEAPRFLAKKVDWYSGVSFYFGTNRAYDEKKRGFTNKPAEELTVGEAKLTIPRPGRQRKVGDTGAASLIVRRFRTDEELDMEKHIRLVSVTTMSGEDFRKVLGAGEGDVLLFVHGFKNSFKAAAYRFAQIIHDTGFEGVPLMYSWPSRNWFTGYIADSNAADAAAPHLAEFLRHVTESGLKIKRLCIIAHSMGNRALLSELSLLKDALKGTRIDEIIMAAPDINSEKFRGTIYPILRPKGAETSIVGGMTLYAARHDRALWFSSLVAFGRARIGRFGWRKKPFVQKDMDTIDVSAAGNFFQLNHTLYVANDALVADIRGIVRDGKRPPDTRGAAVRSACGGYYIYRKS